jgi:Ca-activated chloride channel homolog
MLRLVHGAHRVAGILTLLTLLLPLSLYSQLAPTPIPAPERPSQSVISVTSNLVALPVSVTDKHGNFVSGLSEQNFHVYENGRLQKITLLQEEDSPASIGLVIDHSGSMGSKLPSVVEAISAFLHSSNPQDEMFVVDFNDDVWVNLLGGKGFTSNPAEIMKAVGVISPHGRTALYDAVVEGLIHLQLAHREKKALILISDGGDNASKSKYPYVLELVRQSQVMIYSVGLVGDPGEEENPQTLMRLARDTGGVAFFPSDINEVQQFTAQIARDLRHQYIVGYIPENAASNRSFRRVQVKVSAPGGSKLLVRTRPGYSVSPASSALMQQEGRIP